MSPTEQITAFAQSIYLVIKNRYFDDIESEDGQTYISQVIDWTNQYLDELENITDQNGNVVNWNWSREVNYELGQVSEGDSTLTFSSNVMSLIPDQHRAVELVVDDEVVSRWALVTPEQIHSNPLGNTENLAAVSGGNILQFSRAIREDEDGAMVRCDALLSLPRLSTTNVRVLRMVKPKQLLVLGVAKNATLPDIVQGGLSPSYVQKYNDLLIAAIARNSLSSRSDTVKRENFSHIGGVGF